MYGMIQQNTCAFVLLLHALLFVGNYTIIFQPITSSHTKYNYYFIALHVIRAYIIYYVMVRFIYTL